MDKYYSEQPARMERCRLAGSESPNLQAKNVALFRALPMSPSAVSPLTQPAILGFDPGRQKCGVAVMGLDRTLYDHAVISAETAIAELQKRCAQYPISLLVMGDQTSSKQWKAELELELKDLRIVLVDERYSTLEARDRYWQMYPPKGMMRLLPEGLRTVPCPIDDIVAILLIERYLERLKG
jgi:RNase H-fold protein (predicted Holliday junction resolvase)